MMSLRSTCRHALLALAVVAIAGCGGDGASDETVTRAGELQYEPLLGALPSPNDLAFQGSEDGTLNAETATPVGSY